MSEYYISPDEEWFSDGPYKTYDEAMAAGRAEFVDGFYLGEKGKTATDIIKGCDFAERIVEECDDAMMDRIELDESIINLSEDAAKELDRLVFDFLVAKKSIGGQFAIQNVKWVHPLESMKDQ